MRPSQLTSPVMTSKQASTPMPISWYVRLAAEQMLSWSHNHWAALPLSRTPPLDAAAAALAEGWTVHSVALGCATGTRGAATGG